MIELNDGLIRPEAHPHRLPRDYFPGRFEQHTQDLERSLLESNPTFFFAQFAPSKVKLKWAEPHIRRRFRAPSGMGSFVHVGCRQFWSLEQSLPYLSTTR